MRSSDEDHPEGVMEATATHSHRLPAGLGARASTLTWSAATPGERGLSSFSGQSSVPVCILSGAKRE